MQVFDEATKTWVPYRKCKRIVVEHLPDQIIFGYTSRFNTLVKMIILCEGYANYFLTDLSIFKGKLLFSKLVGSYFSPINMDPNKIMEHQAIKGCGDFPYLLNRKYEAVDNFDKFEGRQQILNNSDYIISNYLDYTFGLEFETSQGFIPEDICYRDGLIPLRDGSISGPEYSTVVLKGNDGIALLEQQLDTLKEYTNFNKNCSLHIHFGNYPLNPEKLYNLYYTCKHIEEELVNILPLYTFESSKYKENGKDYCKVLKTYSSFNKMYEHLVGRKFLGSFTQPHPNDVDRERKWNVLTRYYWCNFINALCYSVNKTIEFRFLRPTYNFKKILLWLYIFNGILKFSEKEFSKNNIHLESILRSCYPNDLVQELLKGIFNQYVLTRNQTTNGDYIGSEVWEEDSLFNNLKI